MLGSSRTMVQAGQTSVCYDADFYPFGGERDITSTCTQNYKFEGKERDTETGNDDFGARYYTSRLGRWLSADWSGVPAPVPYANLTNPQTLNLYAMVSDNPETFDDLDGHDGGGICDVNRNGCPNSGQSTNAPPPTGGKDPKSNSPNTGTGSVGQSDAQKAQQTSQQNRPQEKDQQSKSPLPPGANPAQQAAKYKTQPKTPEKPTPPADTPNPTEPPRQIVPGQYNRAPIGTTPETTPTPNPEYMTTGQKIIYGVTTVMRGLVNILGRGEGFFLLSTRPSNCAPNQTCSM